MSPSPAQPAGAGPAAFCEPSEAALRSRRYRARHPDRAKAQAAAYYASHLESERARGKRRYEQAKGTPTYERILEVSREAARRYQAAHPERVLATQRRQRAERPEALRVSKLKWCAANPQRVRENKKRWWAAHPEAKRVKLSRHRARKRGNGGAHTAAEWIALCWASAWRCLYCGVVLNEKTTVQEHKIPLARGGTDNIENIAVSCMLCNARKGAKTAEEFLARRARA